MTPSSPLVALAEKQFGVIAHPQLLALGFTEGEIRGHIRRGLLHRIHPGVYAVGHRRLAPTGKLLAAQLSCGPTAFLSHRTAAALWGLRGLDTRRIHVTVPGSSSPIRPGLKIHRTRNTRTQSSCSGIHVIRITEFRLDVEPQAVLSDVLALTTGGASPAG
jgi:predicted transcriptional regulator of viral defense system